MSARHERVHRVFTRAADLGAGERTAFLDDACSGDSAIRRDVEAMLEADAESTGGFDIAIEAGGAQLLAGALVQSGELGAASHPERIGQYRIVRVIGEGGMGIVYEAEQGDPKRNVALKVMRGISMGRGLLNRFRHEIRILAHLQHPGIAQIYETGSTDQGEGGQPYFAMELINGQTLTDYATAQQLDTASRLELIAQLCDILHYAHQKSVIHRDLKPANILVTDDLATDSSGTGSSGTGYRLKVLDFGVARATDADLHTVTLQTTMGQLIGTVPYMSPEQAAGDPSGIDIRSDVYAVGVIAWELLTGRLPYDVRGKLVHEAVRVIREDEPSRLSSVDRALRGDVETIVAKALEKDKERRYQSAADLGADIRRHLRHETVSARPASAIYQLGKYARRNKAIVGGAVATLAVAIIGAIVALNLAITATNRANVLERTTYIAEISAASSALVHYDDTTAREHLHRTPERHRGWEFDYLRARLERHTGMWTTPSPIASAPEFDRDGRLVAMMLNGTIGRWDPATGRLIDSMSIEGGDLRGAEPSRSIKVHLPSRRFAAADSEQCAHVGSTADGSKLAELPSNVNLLAWSDDGSMLLYQADATYLWSASGTRRLRDEQFGSGIFVDGDARVVLGGTKDVWLVNVVSGDVITRNRIDDAITDLTLAPDGRTIAAGGNYNNLLLLDVETLEVRARLTGHSGALRDVAWTSDGSRLASISADGTLRTWETDPPRALVTHSLDGADLTTVVIAPGDTDVIVTHGASVMRFPFDDPTVLRGHGSYVYHLAFSPDGRLLASGALSESDVHVWNLRTFESHARFPTPGGGAPTVAFSSDGQRLVTLTKRGTRQWIMETGEALPDLPINTDEFHKAVGRRTLSMDGQRVPSHDGRKLAVCNLDGTVDLLEWSQPHTAGFLNPSPVSNLSDVTRLGQLVGHAGQVWCAAFSPDGTRIATGGVDATVRIWDAQTYEQLLVLRGHTQYVKFVAWSPEGTALASASGDTTVRVWDSVPMWERRREQAAD